jgi:hypothetical protein
MDIVFYNLSDYVPPQREVHTVLPSVLLSSEKAHHASFVASSGDAFDSGAFDTNTKVIAEMYESTTRSAGLGDHGAKVKSLIQQYEKLQRKKFKTKAEFILIAKGKVVVREALTYVRRSMRNYSICFEMHRVNPFIKENLLEERYLSASKNHPGMEDERTLRIFTDVVSEREFDAMMVVTEHINDVLKVASAADDVPSKFFTHGMLKMKMLTLPGFLNFQKNKYRLMREELMPVLTPWWKELKETASGLSTVEFSKDNLPLLKENMEERIGPSAEALDRKLQSNIYIQQLANDEYGEYGSTWWMAMTGRMSLLRYYHATRQITDDILAKLEQYYTEKNLHNKTVCFLVHEVPSLPPVRKFYVEQQEEWDKLWAESKQ